MPIKGLRGKLVLAYAAGIMDGEGTICLTKTTRKGRTREYGIYLQVALGNTSEWLICWFKMQFGGLISYYERKDPNCRPVWHWQISRRKAIDFLKDILPYLQMKRPQAELAIQFQAVKRMGPLSDKKAAVEEAQRLLMKHMNTYKGDK